jgi:hypothetical protein
MTLARGAAPPGCAAAAATVVGRLRGAALRLSLLDLRAALMQLVFRSGQVLPDLRISIGYLYLGPAIGLGLSGAALRDRGLRAARPARLNRDES